MASTIIQLGRTDTGKVIGDFTWDFCKKYGGVDVSTASCTMVEYGAGVYEITNPNITTKTVFSLYIDGDTTKNAVGEFLSDDNVDGTKAILQFGRADTGHVIGDFTWDFCKTSGGTTVSTSGSTLIEFGVGVYELTNPNITEETTFGIYVTADSTVSAAGVFDGPATTTDSTVTLPTYPTMATIVAEGIKKAGYSSSSSNYATLLSRGQTYWIEEIKNEIWMRGKKLKRLQNTGIVMCVAGQTNYSMPTDFSSMVGDTIDLLYGSETGVAQGGATGNIVLASTASSTNNAYQGKEIVITDGTGANQVSRIYSYNGSTKVAYVAPSFTTAPAAASSYMIVDTYYTLQEGAVWDYSSFLDTTLNRPLNYFPTGDSDNGEINLSPAPDKTYAMRIRYYADLMELNLSGTLMGTLYKNWRNVFIQGICAKCLQDADDDRYPKEMQAFYQMLSTMVTKETYGDDMSSLRARVIE